MTCASSASLLFSRLSESATTEPPLSCLRFSYFHPIKSPPFPTSRLQSLWGFLRFFVPPLPSLIMIPASRPWTLNPSMMRRSRWGVGSCAEVVGHSLASSAFSRLPTHIYNYFESPRSLSCSLSRFPSCSRPYPCTRAHPRTRPPFRPRLHRFSRHRFLPPVTRSLISTQYHIGGPAPGLLPEAVGYLLLPPPVCMYSHTYSKSKD